MLSSKDQLTELIRDLEAKKHIFATDPLLVTEKIKHEKTGKKVTNLEKFHRRAKRIDSNGKLAQTLQKIDTRIKSIIILLSVLWCFSGFMGLFALLQSNVVNFFYVLVCILGFHSLTILVWILTALFTNKNNPTIFAMFVNPNKLIRGKDDVTISAVALYKKQLKHSGMRWYLGKLTHQLWLATLVGMLISMVVLLAVKDFSFSWQSTLLSADTIAMIVRALAWLPDLVGFITPTTEQIYQSQQFANESMKQNVYEISSYEWAMLLISSLIMYGIVPRFCLWSLCSLLFYRKKMYLDLENPYYKKIVDFWSTTVVDEDDFRITNNDNNSNLTQVNNTDKSVKKVTITSGKKLVALLEYPYSDKTWYKITITKHMAHECQISDGLVVNNFDNSNIKNRTINDNEINLYNNIEDFGILDGRADFSCITEYLKNNEVQVLLGIHSTALPDRGTLRKLDTIAEHATKGLIIQLLDEDGIQSAEEKKRLEQWLEALASRDIGLVL